MHVWSLVSMLFSVTFEHVFTVKAWHVQLHKEFIGFNIFFLTEISCSKLKVLCCIYRHREKEIFNFFFFQLNLYLHRVMKIRSIPKQAVKPGIIHTWDTEDTRREPSFLSHQLVSAPLVQIPKMGILQMFSLVAKNNDPSSAVQVRCMSFCTSCSIYYPSLEVSYPFLQNLPASQGQIWTRTPGYFDHLTQGRGQWFSRGKEKFHHQI